MWSVPRKTAGPLRRVVAADALEDAGAVVEAVRAHVYASVVPVDQLAVHPDLVRGLHVRLLLSGSENLTDARRDRPCARRRAAAGRSGRSGRGACASPAPTQTAPCWSSVRSITTAETSVGNGATAPGSKPVASTTSFAFATRTSARADGGGDLRARRRGGRPGSAPATYSPSQTKTSDLTICSSRQPTARAASSAVGVCSVNSSIEASMPAAADERRDALHRLGPHGGRPQAGTRGLVRLERALRSRRRARCRRRARSARARRPRARRRCRTRRTSRCGRCGRSCPSGRPGPARA